MAPTFEFEKGTQRYRYTSGDRKGQFVSFGQVHRLTRDYQERQSEAGREILQKMLDEKTSVSEWLTEAAAHLRPAHINMYALGFGGHARLNSAEYGAIGARLKSEYGYLRDFAKDISAGKLSEAQIKARLALYYENVWQTYEKARERSHKAADYQWERRVVSAAGNPCVDCSGFANQGWRAIGSLPTPGLDSVCRSRCRCYKEFDAGDNQPMQSLLDQRHGWAASQKVAQPEMADEEPQLERRATEIDGFYWGNPDEKDLSLINQFTGQEWRSQDWMMVPMRASDNLMWSSWACCWHLSTLMAMERQFPGQAMMLDHNAHKVESSKGFFVRAELTQSDAAPSDIVNAMGNGKQNRDRIKTQGWVALYLAAAIPMSEARLIQAISTRQVNGISTGSILNGLREICPHCSAKLGRDVEFDETNEKGKYTCPHEIPHPLLKMMAEWGAIPADTLFADYAILASATGERHYEASFVGVPNLVSAHVLRN